MSGRILAIGDIHGCATAMDVLLQSIALRPDDTLVTLGDYVDRGPDSRRVLDTLIALRQTHRLVALRGNHEWMMMDARFDSSTASNWLSYGGDTTLASYGADASQEGLAAVPAAHWAFIEQQCRDFWETESHLFVHGDAYPDLPLREQPQHILYWGRFNETQPHESGKTLVCGHTSQKSGLPANKGYAVCIDTWAHGQGWLTCLDVGSGLIRQANQAGQERQFQLGDRPA